MNTHMPLLVPTDTSYPCSCPYNQCVGFLLALLNLPKSWWLKTSTCTLYLVASVKWLMYVSQLVTSDFFLSFPLPYLGNHHALKKNKIICFGTTFGLNLNQTDFGFRSLVWQIYILLLICVLNFFSVWMDQVWSCNVSFIFVFYVVE